MLKVRKFLLRPLSTLSLFSLLLVSPCAGAQSQTGFTISSPALVPNGPIPQQFTCKNSDAGSPPLDWKNVPAGTRTLALIVKDPDAPRGTFIHWVIYNIPATASGLKANVPRTARLADGALQGDNTAGKIGYMGPCPPPGPAHHYHFVLMALDIKLEVDPGATGGEVEAVAHSHLKGETELVATFAR